MLRSISNFSDPSII